MFIDYDQPYGPLVEVQVNESESSGKSAMVYLFLHGELDMFQPGYHGQFGEETEDTTEFFVGSQGCVGESGNTWWDYDRPAATTEIWVDEGDAGTRVVNFKSTWDGVGEGDEANGHFVLY